MSKSVIFTMVGKGGVSKSTTSVWLHQYLSSIGYNAIGFDTDPINATYDSFQGLNTTHINIFNSRGEIDKSLFDELIERYLINLEDNQIAIIDNGATSFNAMLTYLDENDIISLLADYGIDVYMNVPIAGGSEHNECLKGLVTLHNTFDCKKIIWLNHYFGEMPSDKEDPEIIIPQLLSDSLLAIINIPDLNADTFGKAIKEMQKERLTFDEFYASDKFGLMMRNRIKQFKKLLFDELEKQLPLKPSIPQKSKKLSQGVLINE